MRAASLVVTLLSATPVAAEVHDYLIVFGADTVPYCVTKTHTFAAVVRVEERAECSPRVVEITSLSWLPATLKVRGFALRPETGRNVPLQETLRLTVARGARINVWGPYRIRPELAETFKARVATVETCFRYKAACVTSALDVCDCARSIEEMIGTPRRYMGVFGYGAAAASVIVRSFSPWMVCPEQSHPGVATLVGLDEYPLVRREYGDYTSRWDQFRAWLRRR
jgi:hypothetical protein